jgi:hypothetical protein
MAALALLLASPAMAQDFDGAKPPATAPQSGPSSTPADPQPPAGAVKIPWECQPNDVRAECQSAQIPPDAQPGQSYPDSSGTTDEKSGDSTAP